MVVEKQLVVGVNASVVEEMLVAAVVSGSEVGENGPLVGVVSELEGVVRRWVAVVSGQVEVVIGQVEVVVSEQQLVGVVNSLEEVGKGH